MGSEAKDETVSRCRGLSSEVTVTAISNKQMLYGIPGEAVMHSLEWATAVPNRGGRKTGANRWLIVNGTQVI
jgi:hypothetical protein